MASIHQWVNTHTHRRLNIGSQCSSGGECSDLGFARQAILGSSLFAHGESQNHIGSIYPMRAPTPALIRARAKAPLEDLQALHLSSAGVESVRNLEACRRLRSLYADDNRLATADGVAELPSLWRIDLSRNQLRDITALTAFRTLGFLHLERNRLTLSQIACLRGMHVMELRLAGNPNTLSGGAEHTQLHRMEVVALLPNVWILDGHYVSAVERALSIEQHEAKVLASLSGSSDNNAVAGSRDRPNMVSATTTTPNNDPPPSMLWFSSGSSTFGVAEQHPNATKMLDALRDEPERRVLHDLYRLRLIVSFHNEEAVTHNAHVQFAASKRATNACSMPLIFLHEIQKLPRAERLAVAVLLAAYLRFRFDRALLVEALTIQLLESSALPSQAIDDTGSLPLYAMTAITSLLRHQAIEEEESMRHANIPEVTSTAFEDDCEVWKSLPPIIQTLLVDIGGENTGDRGDFLRPEEAIAATAGGSASAWCRRAVQLLSNASSFPDINGLPKDRKSSPSLSSIVALLHAASASPRGNNSHASSFSKLGVASFIVPVTTTKQREWRRDRSELSRPYPRPWALGDGGRTLSESQSTPVLNQAVTSAESITTTSGHRRPRPGEWVQIRQKQFLKILHLSADGAFVSAAPLSQSANVLTIAVNQLTRVSGNAWRVADEHIEAFLASANAKSSVDSLVGKLHRDSEGFHHHGAARNQGFPNHDVQAQDVLASGVGGAKQPRAVGLFAANNTLDANYVLASPHAVAAQNFCASRMFTERDLAPAGLWQPIEHSASFLVAAPRTAAGPQELPPGAKRAPTRRDPPSAAVESHSRCETPDDWGELKRQLQSVLGMSPPPGAAPLASDRASDRASDCLSVFLTSPDSLPAARQPSPSPRSSPFPAASLLPRAASQPRLPRSPWHAVPTRPSFLVPPSSSTSPSASMLSPLASPLVPPPSSSPGLSGARGVLKLRECNLPLPSLSPHPRQK